MTPARPRHSIAGKSNDAGPCAQPARRRCRKWGSRSRSHTTATENPSVTPSRASALEKQKLLTCWNRVGSVSSGSLQALRERTKVASAMQQRTTGKPSKAAWAHTGTLLPLLSHAVHKASGQTSRGCTRPNACSPSKVGTILDSCAASWECTPKQGGARTKKSSIEKQQHEPAQQTDASTTDTETAYPAHEGSGSSSSSPSASTVPLFMRARNSSASLCTHTVAFWTSSCTQAIVKLTCEVVHETAVLLQPISALSTHKARKETMRNTPMETPSLQPQIAHSPASVSFGATRGRMRGA
mmetsp:Transcript_35666/g.115599  ORF Transcript_35666/g.115599 Transcript_35666/m.115599 type:complete len:298 (-) Transcript_35666:323-1216(-)